MAAGIGPAAAAASTAPTQAHRPSAAAVAAAAATRPSASAAAAASTARPRVAVVGAGYAGLAAALYLQRSGCCDVVLLEAGSRAGGRACTQHLDGGRKLELGATWFHGLGTREQPNPVFKHAVDYGLIGPDPEAEQWWSSQFLLPCASQPLSKEHQIAVTHTLAAWGDAVESLPADAAGTTAEHQKAAWAELIASGKLAPEQLEVAQRAWRWRELLQRAMDGCDSTAVQSAQGLALYDEMPGGVHCALPAGMQGVADRLAAEVADLRFRHAVQHIRWNNSSSGGGSSSSGGSGRSSGSGTDGSSDRSTRPVQITCSNGATVQADAAIVTVSLGVLKATHRQLFSPALPEAKAAAIDRLSIGVVDKYFLDFSPAGGEAAAAAAAAAAGSVSGSSGSPPAVSYALLWSQAWESDEGHTAVAPPSAAEARLPGWASGVFSIRFGGPEVKLPLGQQQQQQQLVVDSGGSGGATVDDADSSQAAAAAAAAAVEESKFSPCAEAQLPTSYQAVAWVTGEAAVAMEAIELNEVLSTLRQLAAVFPQLQLPPGASWDTARLYRSSWGSDELFRGSYAYIGAGATPADVAALATPVYAGPAEGNGGGGGGRAAPRLLFAGDSCHTTYIGTMHGAYLTGQSAAELLVQRWQAADDV